VQKSIAVDLALLAYYDRIPPAAILILACKEFEVANGRRPG
jgi:hypothetical protein